MHILGYNQLQEDGFSPQVVSSSSNSTKSQNETLTARAERDSRLVSNDERRTIVLSSVSEPGDRYFSANVRYTPLTETSVTSFSENEVELDLTDQNGRDSTVLVTTTRRRKCIPKTYALICVLLIVFCFLISFALIYILAVLPLHQGETTHPDPRVQSDNSIRIFDECMTKTSCGDVRGTKEETTCVFKGIPYAVPPTGDRRWTKPVARDSGSRTCWRGTFNATNFGSMCVQPKLENISSTQGAEDCLFLNIWTPATSSSAHLPVMVWFHSGDFVFGSGHIPGMSPTSQTAAATNCVYVSFNHRLGVLGFLALDDLREEAGGSAGNYGFMDQQLVLQWVKTNIRYFGGNASLVTIFGHGSGAVSINAMLMSLNSRGLFHRAWLTSPVGLLNKTLGDACRDNREIYKLSGCANIECLRELSVDQVSRSSPWHLQPRWTLQQLFSIPRTGQIRNDLPIIDGHVVQASSLNAMHDGPVVPIIFGSSYFVLSSLETKQSVVNLTMQEYNELLRLHVGGFGQEAVSKVNMSYWYNNRSVQTIEGNTACIPGERFLHLVGDIKSVCTVKILVDQFLKISSVSSPFYMYVLDVYPSCTTKLPARLQDVFVGWDIAAFFGTFQELNYDKEQWQFNLQNIIREEVISFVLSGQPDASRWKPASMNVGVIGRDVTVAPVTSEYFNQCRIWKDLEFFHFNWNQV